MQARSSPHPPAAVTSGERCGGAHPLGAERNSAHVQPSAVRGEPQPPSIDIEVRSAIGETRGAWPVQLLARLGFHPRDAVRLQAVLPHVGAGALAGLDRRMQTEPRYVFWNNPAAHVVWCIQNITMSQAIWLTEAGRGIVDVLTILDAVRKHVPYRGPGTGIDLVHEWAMERCVPRHRLGRYIELGFPPAMAAGLEADPSSPPSEDALETLSALRRPAV